MTEQETIDRCTREAKTLMAAVALFAEGNANSMPRYLEKMTNENPLAVVLAKYFYEFRTRSDALLREIEWIENPDGTLTCPLCGSSKKAGHLVGCDLAAALES